MVYQRVNLTIQSLGVKGEGIGYWNGHTLLVDGSLPGEVVEAEISELERKWGRGYLTNICSPSPWRVNPPCPAFDRCGGCQLMHLDYPQQLIMKQQRVIKAFQYFTKREDIHVLPCIPSPRPLGYRNKIQLPIVSGKKGIQIGLYARNSHELIEIDRCLVHCEQGENIFQRVRTLLKQYGIMAYNSDTKKGELRHLLIKTAINTGEVLVTFVTNAPPSSALINASQAIIEECKEVKGVVSNIQSENSNVVLGKTFQVLCGADCIHETLFSLIFKISPASFFQVNTQQAEQLYAYAIRLASLSGQERILDAYCGVGTLSLLAALKSKHVTGIECVPEAIEDAKENGRRNDISNASFLCDTVEALAPSLSDVDIAFLNPPRKGCEPTVLSSIAACKPRKIIYISCDPATLARDAAILHNLGYSMETVQPFDMFPQTSHVECVANFIPLQRKES